MLAAAKLNSFGAEKGFLFFFRPIGSEPNGPNRTINFFFSYIIHFFGPFRGNSNGPNGHSSPKLINFFFSNIVHFYNNF